MAIDSEGDFGGGNVNPGDTVIQNVYPSSPGEAGNTESSNPIWKIPGFWLAVAIIAAIAIYVYSQKKN